MTMPSGAVRHAEPKVRRASPWRLIAYECAAAAVCAVVIGLLTTALDFAANMPMATGPASLGRVAAALALLGMFFFVAVRLQQIVGALHSPVWKREH